MTGKATEQAHPWRELAEQAERHFWEFAPGKRLAWLEFGDPDGAPVMYFHGWPSSAGQAGIAHEQAAERGLRLISMDRPGMGKSSRLPGRRLADWPDFLARFADHLGLGRFGQMGVSGGGPYVLASAAAIPERLAGSVVLAGMVPLPLVKHGERHLSPAFRALIPFRKLPGWMLAPAMWGLELATWLDPSRLPRFLVAPFMPKRDQAAFSDSATTRKIARAVRVGIGGRGSGALEDGNVYFEDPGFGPGDVRSPVRWWHGTADRHIALPLVEELFEKLPVGELVAVPDYGHFSLAVDYCPQALDYLAESLGVHPEASRQTGRR